eukprot:gnl/Hemi2/23249_TR7800_c0_g2_i1.p1 gnl/Hemi2/23249_TR7800_c0_g2~~gnl/Hemi2/23249_TR7800_c0_g2_i1.p1  ORF type:complete len:299 (-),score=33.78 gnl/Hemi2/23249_TR7800_c0_g2_i1:196-1092(-)
MEGADNRGKTRVGVVGYGKLGHFLVQAVLHSATHELAFVWNRSCDAVRADTAAQASNAEFIPIPATVVLENLDDFASRGAQLIVEVAHPAIMKTYGVRFLEHADVVMGSPTAMADADVEVAVRTAAGFPNGHGLYVPSGAFWGANDIRKMADRGTLRGLSVEMQFHPSSLRLVPPLSDTLAVSVQENKRIVLYEGSVRGLCPLAPNNVNTMACGCIAAHNLGFDRVACKLISDPSLEAHVIDIEVVGPTAADGSDAFRVATHRHNPAKAGAVTGAATYVSFWSSILEAGHKGDGVHLC